MTEEPIIIQMTIAHYGAMLKLDLDDNRRSMVERCSQKPRSIWSWHLSKESNSARNGDAQMRARIFFNFGKRFQTN
jgi:hypothetical protein